MKSVRSVVVAALASWVLAPAAAAPPTVEMTWMSIANWYFKIGNTRIVMDGYITRVPEDLFIASSVFPKDMYTYTKGPYGVDTSAVGKVRDAMIGTDKLDLLLAGHAHWDHSWDTPAWSRLTGTFRPHAWQWPSGPTEAGSAGSAAEHTGHSRAPDESWVVDVLIALSAPVSWRRIHEACPRGGPVASDAGPPVLLLARTIAYACGSYVAILPPGVAGSRLSRAAVVRGKAVGRW